MKEYAKAIKPLRETVKLDTENEKAYYNLALAYQGVGEFDKAVVEVKMALEINPEYELARQLLVELAVILNK